MFDWLQIFPAKGTTFKLVASSAGLQFAAQTIAMEKAIDLIANMISKCEFRTYVPLKGKVEEQFGDDYYTLNVRPNPNKTSTEFWKEVVKKAFTDFEAGAVVVIMNGSLFLAESFEVDDKALVAKTFKNIYVDKWKINRTFSMDEVLFIKINNAEIGRLMASYYTKMDNMISYAMNDYKQKNGMKLLAEMPARFKVKDEAGVDVEIAAQAYVDQLFKGIFENDNVAIPINPNIKVTLLGEKIQNKDSTDVRALIRHVFEDVATAFHIPRDVFFGTKTEKSTSMADFLTFAVDNPIQVLEDELNAKQITKANYLLGERVLIDKTRMQHFDIIDSAASLDKLTGIGFSHNDIRRIINMPYIDEEWANVHNVTKNYAAPNIQEGGDSK